MAVVYSQDRDGARLATFPARKLVWKARLNRPGACTFEVNAARLPDHDGRPTVHVEDVADPDQGHEIVVQRNGATVWTGPLVTVDETRRTIRFGAEGLMAHLRGMHVTTTLETSAHPEPIVGATIIDADQHLIVKALVDHHQGKAGGDFRIDTTAVSASGTTRQRQYKGWEIPNAYVQVVKLTEVLGGPDVDIDPATRQLQLWTPRRGRRRNEVVFNDRNVRQFGRRKDRTGLATQILGRGAGEGKDTLRIDRQDSQAVSRVGLVQQRATHTDVTEVDTLRDHADHQLMARSHVPNLYSVTVATNEPPLGSWELGDEVRIHYDSPYKPVDEFRRLVGWDVTAAEDGREETATLYLERLGAS